MKSKSSRWHGAVRLALLGVALTAGHGCMSPRLSELAAGLETAAATHPDPALVSEALPAYLILMDAMIVNAPNDGDLLLSGAALYTTYAGMPIPDGAGQTRRVLPAADRALDYAMRAWRALLPNAPDPRASRHRDFERTVRELPRTRQALLHGLGTAWLTWCRLHTEDVLAAAELPRAEILLRRSIELDPAYRNGTALVLLGAVAATLPAEMGGDLEAAKQHFERALQLESPSPMAAVLYARAYAVAVQDRELFERLLKPLAGDETTGSHSWVQSQARTLLKQADALFGPRRDGR